MAQYSPSNIKIESGQLPEALLPELQPGLESLQMRFHPVLVRVIGIGQPATVRLTVADPNQRPLGEADQLAVDRDPLAGIFRVIGIRLLSRDEVEVAGRRNRCASH